MVERHTTRRLVGILRGAGLVWCKTAKDYLSDAKQVPNQVLKGTPANHDIAPRAPGGPDVESQDPFYALLR